MDVEVSDAGVRVHYGEAGSGLALIHDVNVDSPGQETRKKSHTNLLFDRQLPLGNVKPNELLFVKPLPLEVIDDLGGDLRAFVQDVRQKVVLARALVPGGDIGLLTYFLYPGPSK